MTTKTLENGTSGWAPARLRNVAKQRPLRGYKIYAKFGIEVPKDVREHAKNLPPKQAQKLLRVSGHYKLEGFAINLPDSVVFKAMREYPSNTREAQITFVDITNVDAMTDDMQALSQEGHFFVVLDFGPVDPTKSTKGQNEPINVLDEIIKDKLSSPVGTRVRADDERTERAWQKVFRTAKSFVEAFFGKFTKDNTKRGGAKRYKIYKK